MQELTPIQFYQCLFDIAAPHLIKQGARSTKLQMQVSRLHGDGGRKSAIGSLIPANMYHISLDYMNIHQGDGLLMRVLESTGLGKIDSDGAWVPMNNHRYPPVQDVRKFLTQLEEIHDRVDPAVWDIHLQSFAGSYGLDGSCIAKAKITGEVLGRLEGTNLKFRVPMVDLEPTEQVRPVPIAERLEVLSAHIKRLAGLLDGVVDKAELDAELIDFQNHLTLALSGANQPSKYWIDNGTGEVQWYDDIAPIIREAVVNGCGPGSVLRIQCAQLRPTLTVTVHEAELKMRCDIAHDKEVV